MNASVACQYRTSLLSGLKLADAGVSTEPQGLTTTQDRPADILTTAAVPGRSAALDVCVASPNAAGAGGDAAEAAFRRKLRRYRRAIPELAAAGIAFRPMIWTADGRPHPAATRTLTFAAELATRRSGQGTAKTMLRRWRHEIQISILKRRAAMTRSVLPALSDRDAWLLRGCSNGDAVQKGSEPCLELDPRFDGLELHPEAALADFRD